MFARENPIIASPAFKLAAQWLSQSLVVTQTSSRGSPESRTACGTIGKIPQVFEDFNGDFRNRFHIHKAYVSGQNFRPETYRPYQFQGISSQNMPKHMVLTYLHFGIQFPFLKITILIYGPRLYRVSDMGSTLPRSSPKKLRLPDTFFISVHGCRINQPITWSHGDVKLR